MTCLRVEKNALTRGNQYMASGMTHAVVASSDIVQLYEAYLQMFWTESAVSQIMAEFLVPTLIDDDHVQAPSIMA
jgi:hypothetical protein